MPTTTLINTKQKSMGTIPGGLLSEEGPGQMVPLTEEQRIMDERERALAEAYTTPVPSQQDMWRKEAGVSAFEGPETANMQLSPYELTLLAENQVKYGFCRLGNETN